MNSEITVKSELIEDWHLLYPILDVLVAILATYGLIILVCNIIYMYKTMHPSKPADQLFCPACGYYCNGKGGYGCIDKPKLVEMESYK